MTVDGSPAARLAQMDAVLRDLSAAPIDRLHAAWGLFDCFAKLTDMPRVEASRGVGDSFAETTVAHGLALSPFDAAMCLRDPLRTYAFAAGVTRAIRHLRAKAPDRPVRMLYAGTGPFAPLAALQVPHVTPDDVEFTLIDLHARSSAASRTLFEALKATHFVKGWIVADAGDWAPAGGDTYDLIVAEVMQTGLRKEPQVQVMRNLSRHLAAGGIFLPEAVHLDLAQADPAQILDPAALRVLGRAMTLSLGCAAMAEAVEGRIALPALALPEDVQPETPVIMTTRVETFGGLALDHGMSGLTMPLILHTLPPLHGVRALDLHYRLGEMPELVVSIPADER